MTVDQDAVLARRVRLSLFSGVAARVAGALGALLATPIMLGALGTERFGALSVVVGLTGFLGFADLGVGGGVQTLVSQAGDDAARVRRICSSAFFALAALAVAILVMAAVLVPLVGWARLLGFRDIDDGSARLALAAFVVPFAIGLPLTTGQRALVGLQKVHLNNVFGIVAPVVTVLGAVVLAATSAGMPAFVAVTLLGPVAVASVACWWLWHRSDPALPPRLADVSREETRRLLRIGGGVMVFSVAMAVAYQTDVVVVSHHLGEESVAQYAVVSRVHMLLLAVLSSVGTALWPAFGGAFAARRLGWIRRSVVRMTWRLTAASAAVGAAMVVTGPTLIDWWLGGRVEVERRLLLAFALLLVVTAAHLPAAMAMTGAGMVGFQAVTMSLMATVNIGLSLVLVRSLGVSGPVWASVVSLGLLHALPVNVCVARRFRGTEESAA